jgi:hypothetical protein
MKALGRFLTMLVVGVLMSAPMPAAWGTAPVEIYEEIVFSALPAAPQRQTELFALRWQGPAGLAPTRALGSPIHLAHSVALFTLFCVWRE